MHIPQATSSLMGSVRNPTADTERKRVNFDEEAGMTEGLVIKKSILEEEEDEESPIQVSVEPSGEEGPHRLTTPSPASSRSVSDITLSKWGVPPEEEGIALQASSSFGKSCGSQASIAEGEHLLGIQSLKEELEDDEEKHKTPQIKSYIKSRMPGLVALTLPDTPEPPSMHGAMDEDNDSDNGSAGSGQHSAVALMTTRRMAPLTTRRLKTRLQDPPAFIPTVGTQLSRCGSTVAQRRVSISSQMSEEAAAVVSNADVKESQSYTLPTSRTSLASMPSASRMEPARIPSYVGGLRTPLNSKSVPIPQTTKPPTATMATLDEEQDPLDDESIPKYKKWKSERRWFVWAQYVALLSLVPLLICSIYIQPLERIRWLSLGLWRWLALALVVISGRLMSGWLIQILVLLIERHYLLRKRVLYFVYGLRRAVKNCIWLALVLGVWKVIFEANQDEHLSPIVTKILWCCWIASLLWMIKVMAVKVAANSFHRAAYFDRIQDNLFHQYVMETLSAPPSFNGWVDFGTGQAVNMADAAGQEELTSAQGDGNAGNRKHLAPGQLGEADQQGEGTAGTRHDHHQHGGLQTSKGRMSNGSSVPTAPARQTSATGTPVPIIARSPIPFLQDKLQELTSDTVSAWTLKRLMKIIRSTNMTTYASMFAHQQGEWEIDSETQAKGAAKEIFYNVGRPGQKSLQFNDFLNFFQKENASRAFHLFEVNEFGNITKKALMKWVVTVYKERRALALTLSDNRTVVAKLHRVLDVVLTVILITIFFLILGVNTSKLLVALSSTLLPSVFVFGNSARSTFESLVFLFVMHPFDVGDRISVDGQSFIVEELNILNTIFLSGSNEKVYYPNSLLSTKPISNFYRSPDQWDSIDFQIHFGTPVEKLGMLKERMTRYIESLPQFWYPAFRIVCKDIQDSNKMFMSIWIQHHLNYQEAGERWQRRSNMILHMKQQMEELAIGYRLPMADITVTGVPVLDVPPVVHH